MRRSSAAAVVVLLACACAAQLRIPDGNYSSVAGGTLTVRGEDLEVRVPAKDSRVGGRSGTTVIYKLAQDGSVRVWGSSNSPYFAFELSNLDWRWTGSSLESRDRRDGTVVTYTPVLQ